jgi:hypothetical protein
MQMNFSNTPLDVKQGETLYMVVYDGKKGVWYSPVSFDEIKVDVKQTRYGHGNYFDIDYYTVIMKYIDEKNKLKEIKVKFDYSKKSKPVYKKSCNFVYIEDATVTCTKVNGADLNKFNVYITKDESLIKNYIEDNFIFVNALAAYQKEIDLLNEEMNKIMTYDI